MNKYAKNKTGGAGSGHNGTINGLRGKEHARRERHAERSAANEGRTNKERLASLDKRGLVAKRERARLTVVG